MKICEVSMLTGQDVSTSIASPTMLINFQKILGIGSIVTKIRNIKCTIVKSWETFYGCHMALTAAVVKIKIDSRRNLE